ncbi:catalase [Bradyrhizobium lupini HPC(L)]|uniref:Catalase n=1 Tax=Bradyrhizobium lupini HPC(L) TaxID=1229491 RepID=A0ABN0HKC0_RHILU|nr:catalase [Bradyrhizobium lupini HPC(L)]
MGFQYDGSEPAQGRWSTGASIDGKGEFSTKISEPLGQKPELGPAKPGGGAQKEQM